MIKETFDSNLSWLQTIHPVIRVLSAIIYSFCIAMMYKSLTLSFALGSSFCMVLVSNLKFKFIYKRLLVISSFLILIWIILPLSYEAQSLTNIILNQSGISLALQITLKTLAITFFFMALIATMSLNSLGYSLRYICVPKKMIYLILMTYRYLFLIEEEFNKLLRTIALRGFLPGTNIHTYRTYSYVLGMLFIRAYERSRRVYNAMLCRNFKGDFFNTKEYRFNWQSFTFIMYNVLLLTILFFFEIKG